ncbi:SET domain-containing protein [Stereum hirsutum FP-91666 SS1]|uniref:SET domain-containing protein n=1 Tax=Stereum hirsutum (strain FP-91666) TaxID=721885 RepID=UPI000440DABA|nr:SET domain-containing protein [Stereum hirsutum FP-91666 SS1]EIM92048.1 SET domain-containing protein [Stereum hirsutum FP-91666 SS1]
MELDPADFAYPLNRSMANLKLQRWSEAKDDASRALELDHGNLKAFWRRSIARRGLGDYSGARQDIRRYADVGGELKNLVDEDVKIASAEAAAMLDSMASEDSTPSGFVVKESPGKGYGAFATQTFQRGDLIFAERPLYTSNRDSPLQVVSAVSRLSPNSKAAFMSLHNAWSGDNLFGSSVVGLKTAGLQPEEMRLINIHQTNSFSTSEGNGGLFLRCSRFNHSCLPSAKYNFHEPTGVMRIYALRTIEPEEEIHVGYLSGSFPKLYGTPRSARRARFERTWGFTCECAVCSLTGDAQIRSDERRTELTRLWKSVPNYDPSQTRQRLLAIVRGVRLLDEERYAADRDDFTNDAAAICGYHSDWVSVAYFARITYECRVAEFGGDSPEAGGADILTSLLHPRDSNMAGLGAKKIFDVRI